MWFKHRKRIAAPQVRGDLTEGSKPHGSQAADRIINLTEIGMIREFGSVWRSAEDHGDMEVPDSGES